MKRKLRFYSEGDWGGHGTVSNLLIRSAGMEEVKSPIDADIIVFNGGEDISSGIYGEAPVPGYGIPREPSTRDRREMDLFEKYKDDESKMFLGICRGAQLLNCLNGGKLFQHVDNHTRNHDMCVLATGEIIRITSTHHQQMRPGELGELLATASESTIKLIEAGPQRFTPTRALLLDNRGDDAEIVWYPATRTLCIQGHPEYVPGSQFADYSLALVSKYMVENVKCAA